MTAIYTTTHAGLTAIRRSAGHIEQQYTHAVWAKHEPDKYWNGLWACEAYASRLDLAQARAREYANMGCEVAIAAVTCEIKLTKRQREFAASRASAGAPAASGGGQ